MIEKTSEKTPDVYNIYFKPINIFEIYIFSIPSLSQQ